MWLGSRAVWLSRPDRWRALFDLRFALPYLLLFGGVLAFAKVGFWDTFVARQLGPVAAQQLVRTSLLDVPLEVFIALVGAALCLVALWVAHAFTWHALASVTGRLRYGMLFVAALGIPLLVPYAVIESLMRMGPQLCPQRVSTETLNTMWVAAWWTLGGIQLALSAASVDIAVGGVRRATAGGLCAMGLVLCAVIGVVLTSNALLAARRPAMTDSDPAQASKQGAVPPAKRFSCVRAVFEDRKLGKGLRSSWRTNQATLREIFQ
jgi:hypothetical protein